MNGHCPPAGSQGSHLENSRVAEDAFRAKNRLDALLAFVQGRDGGHSQIPTKGSSSGSCDPDCVDIERLWISDTASCERCSDPQASPLTTCLLDTETPHQPNRKPNGSDAASNSIPASSIYSRASSLLLSGMDVDGILFLKAPRNNSRSNSRRSSCVSSNGLAGLDASSHRRSSSQSSNDGWGEATCEGLGFASSRRNRNSEQGNPCPSLNRELLRALFTSFPEGVIINSIPGVDSETLIHPMIVESLRNSLPAAKSVLFMPILDWNKSSWAAGAILWTHHDEFAGDSLPYVRAFGHSIVSELTKVEQDARDKMKEDLLSSVSHELRTPLHGLLANSELLQSSPMDPAQHEMVKMIQTCGETLLDTMNHLLSFAKINNFTTHRLSIDTAAQISDLTTGFHLDSMLEDIADSLLAGYHTQRSKSNLTARHTPIKGGTSSQAPDHGRNVSPNGPSVVVRVEKHKNWMIKSIPGAWRRVILELLGNALKFTSSGLIEASLALGPGRCSYTPTNHAHLTFRDTGCGISLDYLQNKIFTPFTQEHVLTDGVGLGLSIVHRLLTQLGGLIDIRSEVGGGTQVDVWIPVEFAEGENVPRDIEPISPKKPCSRKKACLLGFEPAQTANGTQGFSTVEAERSSSIQHALSSALHKQGWKLFLGEDLNNPIGDVAILEQSTLERIGACQPIITACRSLIIIEGYERESPSDIKFDRPVNVVSISQPLGPRKIRQALEKLSNLENGTRLNGHPLFPLPENPVQEGTSSAVLAAGQGPGSPPAVRNSVSEYMSPPTESLEGLHVLIVDDNAINLKLLARFMGKIGCTYETASNGQIAVENYKASQTRFAYVLMDISMPVMDGITAARTIRDYEEENWLPRSTIMAITAISSSEMEEQVFDSGMDEHLVKPLSLRDLKRVMGLT